MSVNLSQNQEILKQQGTFGAAPIETPPNIGIYQSMGIPTSGKELAEWAPYFATAMGASKLFSDAAVYATTRNPMKAGAGTLTLADTYSKSRMNSFTKKIDNLILPHINKHSGKINYIKSKISQYTPNWVKNAIEKMKIGVTPKNKMALTQYRGCTFQAADAFLNSIREVPSNFWQSIGVKDVSDILKNLNGNKKNALKAVELIAERLKDVPADKLYKIPISAKKHFKLVTELNKVKGFMGAETKTFASKYLNKLGMASSEAAGGGVIGGGWFGLIMNSIFLASTIKRTWNAPQGEKFSTFMEGALVEFCGGYLMMLLGTRLTYKLLGLKNIDKTAQQIKTIGGLTKGVNTLSQRYKDAVQLQKLMQHGEKAEGIISKLSRKLKGIDFQTYIRTQTSNVIGDVGKYKKMSSAAAIDDIVKTYPSIINKSIDKLANMRKFQKNGNGFFRNLFNRPIRWIGNFFSTGLENLPVKVGTKGMGKAGSIWRSFANKFKSCLGYPLRFALVMFVVTPPLTNLLAKISHGLFGKPTNSIYNEEKKEDAKKQAFSELTKQIGQMREAQQPTILPAGYTPTMSKTLIDNAIDTQRNKLNGNINNRIDISPATYIPNPVASITVDHDIQNELQRKIAKSYRVENFVNRELTTAKEQDKL